MQTEIRPEVLTVSELTFSIKKLLEESYRRVYVRGEISNFKLHSSGHLYFSLKDQQSQISAALFKGNAKNLSRLPRDGDQVTLIGDISVYPPRGGYQILVKEIHFLGLGELLLQFHQLKEKLSKEGLFDSLHKKQLPHLPKKIGVITSETGAVIQDILHVLKRRFSGFHLILYPVRVQGETAAREIATAIDEMNRHMLVDVLIVGRGGGSLEDLWPFNEEVVVRAIYRSNIPIVSAVGHETDHTLADLAADIRAPTPSAAAEIVMREQAEMEKFLREAKERISLYLQRKVRELKSRLTLILSQQAFTSPQFLFLGKMQQLDEMREKLELSTGYFFKEKKRTLLYLKERVERENPQKILGEAREKLKEYERRITQELSTLLRQKQERLSSLSSHLRSIDPRKLMMQGYAKLFSEKSGSIILSAKEVEPKDRIRAVVRDGVIYSEVIVSNKEQI